MITHRSYATLMLYLRYLFNARGAKNMTDEQIKRMAVRLPADLHAEIARAAKEDRRSIHGEMLHFLYEQLKKRPAKQAAKQAA